MKQVGTITWLTFLEGWRRWMVIIALVLGLLFVILYGIGANLVNQDMLTRGVGPLILFGAHNFMVLAGLYVVHILTVTLTIFASVDTISGEITSHTIQTIVTKPISRWQVLVGKGLGYAAMLVVYLVLLGGGILLASRLVLNYVPDNAVQGVGVIMLEALVLLSLSLLAGTRLSTMSNGVALFLLYGMTFIGTWVEQIGALLQSQTALRIGALSHLVLPVEGLWRYAASLMTPSGVNQARAFVSPFSSFTTPDSNILLYAIGYAAVAFLLAIFAFSRRDL